MDVQLPHGEERSIEIDANFQAGNTFWSSFVKSILEVNSFNELVCN